MSSRPHKITRRKITCFQCSTLGFSKYVAETGDWITYKEHCADNSYHPRHARVVGWVKAPFQKGSEPQYDCLAFEGVCVVALNDDATSCFERWIKPEDIISIHMTAPNFLQYFASADPKELLAASEYGSASASHTDWQEAPLPCGYPGCTAPHQHRADGTPQRWPAKGKLNFHRRKP